jgi:hypothetical protein
LKIFYIFLIASHLLWAADPQIDIDYERAYSSSILQDRNFAILKEHVCHYLRGSWCTEEKANLLMDLVALTQPNLCVEIGVGTGSSILPIAAALAFVNSGIVFGIDSWSNEDAVQGIPMDDPHYHWWSTVNMPWVMQRFLQTIDTWALNSFCSVIPTSSKNAASLFERIDFLHLDGNFSEEGSLQDVLLYLPKVNPGGYILLSNVFATLENQFPKMRSLAVLLDHCEMVYEIESSNAILFQKN